MPIAKRKVTIPGVQPPAQITIRDVMRFVDNCYDMDTLRGLAVYIRNHARVNLTAAKKRALEEGDTVRFRTKHSGDLVGKIEMIMRTNARVNVRENGRERWFKVPLTMLEYVGSKL